MDHVTSADGTRIAYDKQGRGPAVVLVAGAFSYRRFPGLIELSALLAERFTVYNYDRRGRGDSGDTQPYDVQREVEDLAAVVRAAGGEAAAWGLSSGAVLALRAAKAGVPLARLALYEPPFVTTSAGYPPHDFAEHLETLIAQGKRGEAVKYFMTKGMGAPGFVIPMMRIMPGVWKRLTSVAHTLPYDAALLEGHLNGEALTDFTTVGRPTLVLSGGKSAKSLQHAAKDLADALPQARHRTLDGQNHNVSMKVLAPVVAEFLRSPAPASHR
ncbi:alpha/beta hydrolase [Amycolatopsis carbonis]|uniref:Alpha/beta hydrolase n=1 Tax=Amycolatopsis carbonis TaxID=715471 RepID=A0A9Y2IDM0_9PSEU|nr:alpha/beta hydrolase [Amycolatopsis sp. 2-15]WIX78440.1 alpha/beta hydrolase [Amycolatopsis sp. 2-15]